MVAETVFIVNPASANGRTRRRWPRDELIFRRILGERTDFRMTERPGHATELTKAAVQAGATTVVAVGGDGTLNEVANGFLDGTGRPWNPTARLALFPVGTGADFVKTFPVPRDAVETAKRIVVGETRTIDVGLCEFVDPGVPRTRYFVNVAEFGSGGAVVDRMNRTTKILGGRMSFLIAILRTLPRYENTLVSYEADGSASREVRMNDFVVANGRYFGAGLKPAPFADVSDGLLDVVIFGDIDFKTARRNLPALREGEHLSINEVTHFRCRELRVTSTEEMIDLDGEFVGRHPTRFSVIPGVLPIIA